VLTAQAAELAAKLRANLATERQKLEALKRENAALLAKRTEV
jgi:hypothetical protein